MSYPIYLENTEGTSSKFYEIDLDGCTVNCRYGKIGDGGNTTSKDFDSEEKAEKHATKTANDKRKKGYADATAGDAPAAKAEKPKPAAKRKAEKEAAPEKATKAKKAPAAKAAPKKAAVSSGSYPIYLENTEGTSNKFYEINLDGCTVNCRYGKIGDDGATTSKDFDSEEKAEKHATKTANDKRKKGYV